MPTNSYMFLIAGLIPMIIGAIYYNDMVFGKTLSGINDVTDPKMKKGHHPSVYLITYIFCCMIAMTLMGMCIHQTHIYQLLMPEVAESGSDLTVVYNDLMSNYGTRFRTFGHGALHGAITSVFFVVPLIGVLALFESRGWKYILIHGLYWMISLILMGGLLCKTLVFPILE